jgi:hypothetical protein
MKILLVSILCLLPLSTFASIISFECKGIDSLGVHKFDAKGIVFIDVFNKADGVISIQTQKAQENDSVQIFEEIQISGTRQRFQHYEDIKDSYDRLTLFSNVNYIKNLNLLIDTKLSSSSEIYSIDNFVFRSNCYAVTL